MRTHFIKHVQKFKKKLTPLVRIALSLAETCNKKMSPSTFLVDQGLTAMHETKGQEFAPGHR